MYEYKNIRVAVPALEFKSILCTPKFVSATHGILNSPSTATNHHRTVEGAWFFGGFGIRSTRPIALR